MEALWNFLEHQLKTNQFFGGGLVLMVSGALLAYFRQVPGMFWGWIKRRWVIEIDIPDREPAFHWIDRWLSEHSYARDRARRLTVRTQPIDYRQRQDDPTLDPRPRILFTPAPGVHCFFYRRRLVILNRERPKLDGTSHQAISVRETFYLCIFGRDRRIVRQMLEEARDVALPPGDTRIAIHCPSCSGWDEQLKRLPRPAESVVLRDGLLESLIADVRHFLCRREWYLDRGIPYRRGFLLYGPPGTGKSSAVLAIASALQMDIAILSLSNSSLDDTTLGELFSNVPVNSIVLIEDIDCVFVERSATQEKPNKLTFSGLLNALDGVAAGEGRVLFMTTNHIDRLDPALIRPGRVDRQEWIGLADRNQLCRVFLRFFGDENPAMAEYFADHLPCGRIPMSAVQTFLLRHAESADDALLNLEELALTTPVPTDPLGVR